MSCHFVAQGKYPGALSHTLAMSPRKLMWECITQKNIGMHIAFRLKKKKNHIERWWTQSIYLAKKKDTRKKSRKTKGRNTNKSARQANKIKIKEKLNKFTLKAVFKKKINNEQIHSERMPVEQSWAKRDPHHRIQELCKHLGWHIDFMAALKVYKASLCPEEPLTALLLFSFHTNSQSYG